MKLLLILAFCSVHILSGMELVHDQDAVMAEASREDPKFQNPPLNGLHCRGMVEIIKKGLVLRNCLQNMHGWARDNEGVLLTRAISIPEISQFKLPDIELIYARKNVPRIVRWNRQGTLLAVAGEDQVVRIYDSQNDEPISCISPQLTQYQSPMGISWNPQGTRLAVIARNSSPIHIYNSQTGKQEQQFHPQLHNIILCNPASAIDWHPADDSRIAVLQKKDDDYKSPYNMLIIINSEIGKVVGEKSLTSSWPDLDFRGLSWHPCKKDIIIASQGRSGIIHNLETGEQSEFEQWDKSCDIALHPTDWDFILERDMMYSKRNPGVHYEIKAYSPIIKTYSPTTKGGLYEQPPICSSWHPSGKWVTIGYGDRSIRTFDVSDLIALRAYLREPQRSLSELFFLKHLARAMYKKERRKEKEVYEKDPDYRWRKRQRIKPPKEDLSAWSVDSLHFTVCADCPIDIDNPPVDLAEREKWEHNLIKYVVEDKQQKNYFWRFWKMPPLVKKIAWEYVTLERAKTHCQTSAPN